MRRHPGSQPSVPPGPNNPLVLPACNPQGQGFIPSTHDNAQHTGHVRSTLDVNLSLFPPLPNTFASCGGQCGTKQEGFSQRKQVSPRPPGPALYSSERAGMSADSEESGQKDAHRSSLQADAPQAPQAVRETLCLRGAAPAPASSHSTQVTSLP